MSVVIGVLCHLAVYEREPQIADFIQKMAELCHVFISTIVFPFNAYLV